MKMFLTMLTCLCMVTGKLTAQEHYNGQTIEQILELPEEEIDLGIACLVLAKDAFPQLDIARFDYILDYMVDRIDRLMQEAVDPESRIGMMNTYLYRAGWWNDSLTFTYDLDDLKGEQKENQFLNGYLSTRTGSCVTMPMLHLVLADRLGWPMKASRSVKHFFLRYVADGFKKNNIDATVGGGYRPDELYKEEAGIPDIAIANGVYLRSLSKKEYIASLLLNQARHFHEREADLHKAAYLLQLALVYDPTFASAHWNLGHYYYLLARQLEQDMEGHLLGLDSHTERQSITTAYLLKLEESLQSSRWHRNKARKLGIVLKLPDTFYQRQTESINKFRNTGKY